MIFTVVNTVLTTNLSGTNILNPFAIFLFNALAISYHHLAPYLADYYVNHD